MKRLEWLDHEERWINEQIETYRLRIKAHEQYVTDIQWLRENPKSWERGQVYIPQEARHG